MFASPERSHLGNWYRSPHEHTHFLSLPPAVPPPPHTHTHTHARVFLARFCAARRPLLSVWIFLRAGAPSLICRTSPSVTPTSAVPSRESKATAYALSKLCGASGGGGVGVRRSSSFEVGEGRQAVFPGALDQLGTPKKKADGGHDLGSPTKKARTRKDGRRTLNARLEVRRRGGGGERMVKRKLERGGGIIPWIS